MRLSSGADFPSYFCYCHFHHIDATLVFYKAFNFLIASRCNDYLGISNLNLETVSVVTPFSVEQVLEGEL